MSESRDSSFETPSANDQDIPATRATGDPHGAWEDSVIAWLDGRLAESDRPALERHLASCSACRALLAEYRALFERLGDVAVDELPPKFWDDLARDIDRAVSQPAPAQIARDVDSVEVTSGALVSGETESGQRRLGSWNAVAGGLLAACLAIVVLATLYLEMPRSGSPQAFTTAQAGDAAQPLAEDESTAWVAEEAAVLAADYEDAAADPLAAVADVGETIEDLTPAEADELLDALEAQT